MVLKNILSGLDKEKFDPIVISLAPEGEIASQIKDLGVKVVSLDWKNKINFFPFLRLHKIVKNEKPDIIHAHLFHANLIARLLKIMNNELVVVSTIHNINFGGKLREVLLKFTDFLSDKNVVVSKKILNEMAPKGVITKQNTEIIYNGVDFDFYNGKIDNKNNLKLVAIGRLTEAKGYMYLLKAMIKLKEIFPGIKLSILGLGDKKNELESFVRKNNLEENVFFAGNQSDVKSFLDKNNFFVLASLWEGLPMAICEAMANGKIVIATKVGGVPEIIENGVDGYLINPKDETELADTIESVLKMADEDKNLLSKNAKAKIKSKFSVSIMIKKYEKLYNELS